MNLTLTFAISIHFALYFPVSVFCRFQGYTLLVYFLEIGYGQNYFLLHSYPDVSPALSITSLT